MTILSVIIGLLLALGAGHFVVGAFLNYLETAAKLAARSTEGRVPPAITGAFERALAFLLTAFSGEELILAWIAAKLAANWQRAAPDPKSEREYRTRALIGLMCGVVSVGFGFVGGKIAIGSIPALEWLGQWY